ncbi:MAG: hypothetical protein WC378_19920 [Opitutaceae bacterium]|jgi:hypothetical protein
MSEATIEVVAEIPQDLALVVQSSGLEVESARNVTDVFAPLFAQAHSWAEKVATIKVTDATQVREMKLARESRLALKEIRVIAEKNRTRLKEDSLRRGRAIDSVYNTLEALVKPLEAQLKEQEEFVKRQEEQRKARIKAEREEALRPFGVNTAFYQLAEMPEADWAALFNSTVAAHKAAKEAAEKAEAERIAKEQAEAAERERIRQENEHLRKEAEEREAAAKAERDRLAAEKKAIEEQARKEREAIEAKAKAELEAQSGLLAAAAKLAQAVEAENAKRTAAIEEIAAIQQQVAISIVGRAGVRTGGTVECIEDTLKETLDWPVTVERFGPLTGMVEGAKVKAIAEITKQLEDRKQADAIAAKAIAEKMAEQAAADAKAKVEREAREKAEAEARRLREAQEALKQVEALKLKQEAEAKAKAARAPDREKIAALGTAILAIKMPEVSTPEGQAALSVVKEQFTRFAKWITDKSAAL